MLRFIHAADLHFDRSFEGLQGVADGVAQALPTYNQEMLTNLVEAAILNQVDFVLLVGDTFHQARPSLKAQGSLMEAFKKLAAENILVYLSFGNHDYYDEARYWFEFPDNVFLFTDEQVTSFSGENLQGEDYRVSGFSYVTPHLTKSLVSAFPQRQATYEIGMYHGELGQGNYAPFSVGEMKNLGYDYWALGHIHVPSFLNEKPPICYPGTPQGHNRKETQAGTVHLVSLTAEDCQITPINVAKVIWQKEALAVENGSQKQLMVQIQNLLETIQAKNTLSQLVFVELDLAGELSGQTVTTLETGELQQYLNSKAYEMGLQVQISKLTQHQVTANSPQQGLPLVETQEHLAVYENEELFQQVLAEVYRHPLAGQFLRQQADYPAEVLNWAKERITSDFSMEEDS